MITKQIEFRYESSMKHKLEEFSADFVAGKFEIETDELKITLDEFQFESLRKKLNQLHDEVS